MAANRRSSFAGLKAWLDKMEAKKRERTIKALLVGGGLVVMLGLYYLSGQDKKRPPPPPEQAVGIKLGDERFEDDIRATFEKTRQEEQAQNKEQTKQIEDQKVKLAQQEQQLDSMQRAMEALTKNPGLGLPDVPPPGAGAGGMPGSLAPADPLAWNGPGAAPNATRPGAGAPPRLDPNAPPPAPPVIEYVGAVAHGSRLGGEGLPAGREHGESASGDGVKKKRFYLPVSFMRAKLLTGLKAKTVESARGDPEPMILRVQAPAILPNEVQAALEGCLVVAHGYGSLASERVETRLVSISCLDFEGKSLIDSELKGYVLDSDGVKGIAGHPVSKMGANLARLAMAGAVSGAGEAFQQSSTTSSLSPLGETRSVDPSEIGRAAAGKGVSNAAEEYAKVIADLVKQQAPVIEVGPSKDVTIAVTEGTWLEIKGYEEGGVP